MFRPVCRHSINEAKVNLSGASKGLDGLNTAAKNVDMNSLGRGVETVTAKFSALQVMGVTALLILQIQQ